MNIPGWPGPVLNLKSAASTQDVARRMAEEGAPEWSLVVADRQTGGRGRMDRKWASPPGGLYLSFILRPESPPTFLAQLSADCAHAAARAITAATGLETTVKYPNDVLARSNRANSPRGEFVDNSRAAAGSGRGWRKVCGILIEASGNSRVTDWVVVGMGVNVNNRTPAGLPRASSLSALAGRKFPLLRVLRMVLAELRFHSFHFPRGEYNS